MSKRPWIVEELNRGNYGVMRSSRFGEVRGGFICCEWWCEGYWASSGYYNLCSEKPTIPSRLGSIPSILKGLASPSSFPRSRLLISLWPLIRNTVRNSLNRSSINELPSVPERASRININADVLVIGGGLAGLSVAKELGKLGLRVVVVEGEHYPGGHLVVDDTEIKDLGRGSEFVGKLSKEVSDSTRYLLGLFLMDFLRMQRLVTLGIIQSCISSIIST
ncbi:FAD-binding protein [Vulcanisaeta distributa]|uniref:FAD-dependent oxidoreductase n=1 Tax=Vulcanisaeta distributa TaxID=164451 RepID=UPI000A9DBBD0|nr:FAD-dependent oxidoreductase [Vulcanisaeta distributa]